MGDSERGTLKSRGSVFSLRGLDKEPSAPTPTSSTATVTDPEEFMEITRPEFVKRVKEHAERDDAFRTLPFTVVQLVLFICIVSLHLRVKNRMELESAFQEWIHGYGQTLTGPFIGEHVADVATYWDWLEQSGIAAVFGGRVEETDTVKRVQLVSVSALVGDMQIRQRRRDGSDKAVWLLNEEGASAHLADSPGDYVGAALRTVLQLRADNWLDGDTCEVQLRFSSYGERAQMFALTEVTVGLCCFGVVVPRVVTTAVMIDPYPQVYMWVLDIAYLLLVLYKCFHETYDLCCAARLGCGEFVDYWGFWNVVDWIDVTLGLIAAGLWVVCCVAMGDEALHRLLGDDFSVQADLMALSTGEVNQVKDAIENLRRCFVAFHLVLAANMLAIMAKFFKSFMSNPRLKVVTETLRKSFQDIVHFIMVFATIFLCFTVIGHVLFGSDIVQFSSVWASINTGMYTLMGEFTWYVELQDYPTNFLPSGMPYILVQIWFVCYMFFVLLVLLNMLLAIILGHYSDVTKSSSLSETLWHQSKEFVHWHHVTRHFIKLRRIALLLENDSDPAHPAPVVTEDSLLDAFPSMKQEQAEFLMKWLKEHAMKKMERLCCQDDAQVLKSSETFAHYMLNNIEELSDGQETSAIRLDRLEAKLRAAEEEAKRNRSRSPLRWMT
uniref:Polycystin cation channel PKD1/PKD2 domain-containing protein n=1 Tax=Pyrodinium bahamense TaxID=73915 RepID=A0A7S0ATS6_9DINO